MNNRYDADACFKYENMKSHYFKILHAKSQINKPEQRSLQTLSLHTKYATQKKRKIQQDNKKLVSKITEIKQQKGLLSLIQDFKEKKNHFKSRSFHRKCRDQQIYTNNRKIAQKLSHVKPVIGTKSGWKNQYKQFRRNKNNVRKYHQQTIYNPRVTNQEMKSSRQSNRQIVSAKRQQGSEREVERNENRVIKNNIRELIIRTQISTPQN